MSRKQKLFQRFPIDGSLNIAGALVTTPYHIYDGSMLSLGGTVDGEVATRLLEAEHLSPVLDTNGRALAAIWICNFAEANLGAHHELQVSLFATQLKVQRLKADAFSYFRALTKVPDLMMVCHGLWNDTQRVVQYNSEHLRLNAKLTQSKMDFSGENWNFKFCDTFGNIIAEGSIPLLRHQLTKDTWQIAQRMGIRGTLNLLRTPFFEMPVVNTRQNSDTCNHVCVTYTACDKPLIRKTTDEDMIIIREPIYQNLDFRTAFVQQLKNIGFIFLRPTPLPIRSIAFDEVS
ncbi:hypothetical protein [Pseudochrobactrum asaccharolyticum]|uniref:hypothetical protein n=1 Tax=Pseudochrobactrum asaccharolyticum TaxID=354351 RepID=UPI004041C029